MASVESYKKETHTKIWDMVGMVIHGEELFVFYLHCLPIVCFMNVNFINPVSINSILRNYKY